MKYVLKPSLEHIALVKISVTLWNQKDVWVLIEYFNSIPHGPMRRNQWQSIEKTVLGKAQELPLPVTLKEKILGCIKPIGIRILKWIECHCKGKYLDIQLPVKLCWTDNGIIDRRKTAELIINNESLNPKSYRLVNMYFLESDNLKVWQEIPEIYKFYFCEKYDSSKNYESNHDYISTHFIDQSSANSEVCKLLYKFENKFNFHSHRYLLQFAADGNKVATENILRILRERFKIERECVVDMAKILLRRRDSDYLKNKSFFDIKVTEEDYVKYACFYEREYSDTLCFLLSHMDEEQQMQVFRNSPGYVLECLLEWPRQSYFLRTASLIQDFLDSRDISYLLNLIIWKIDKGFKDYNYKILFQALWQQCSDSNKTNILEIYSPQLLFSLIQIKDDSTVKLILKDATHIQKKTLIFSSEWDLNFCIHLSHREEWDFIEYFIRACISSSDVMLQFKRHVEEGSLLRNKKHKRLVGLLDALLSEYKQNESKVLCQVSTLETQHKRGIVETVGGNRKRAKTWKSEGI